MNITQFTQLVPQLEARIRQAVAIGVAEAAALIAEEAKHLIGHEQSEWPPLADSTVKRKSVQGYETPDPLERTGKLRDSIHFVVEGTSAVIGSDDPVAAIQEHGDAHIPPRPFLSTAAMQKAPEIAELLAMKLKLALKGD